MALQEVPSQRPIPMVHARARTSIVRSRTLLRTVIDELMLAEEILRRLDPSREVQELDDVLAQLEEAELELNRVDMDVAAGDLRTPTPHRSSRDGFPRALR